MSAHDESRLVNDPVCGKQVDTLRARAVAIFGGATYYFCSAECKARYVADNKADRPRTVASQSAPNVKIAGSGASLASIEARDDGQPRTTAASPTADAASAGVTATTTTAHSNAAANATANDDARRESARQKGAEAMAARDPVRAARSGNSGRHDVVAASARNGEAVAAAPESRRSAVWSVVALLVLVAGGVLFWMLRHHG